MDPADRHNRALLDLVRPPAWQPPAPLPRYDLIVVGGGTAGLVAAAGAAAVGATVALVEADRLGGDCLNTGCVPSKTLLASARVAATIADADRFGLRDASARVDFAAVMSRVRAARATLAPHDAAARLAERGVHVFFGPGAFTAADRLEVQGTTLRFRRAVIATGARPVRPAIEGLPPDAILTSETIFEQSDLPARLAIVGGGPVGCELAQAFARLGSRVFLIEAAPRLLARESDAAAGVIRQALERDGVRVLTGADVHHAEAGASGWRLTMTRGAIAETIDVDTVLAAAGRRPNTAGLNLERAGVRVATDGRITVDDRLRTSNSRIFAAGDVCLPWQFTHAADASARLAVQNALFAGRGRASRLLVPRVTYTEPEVASIGRTDDGSRDVTAFTVPLGDLDRAVTDGATEGFAQVLVRTGTDRLVGATIVGARAGEVIGELTLAMDRGVGLRRLAVQVRAYPTYSGVLSRAADAYNRTRLTPRARGALSAWLAVRRRLGA